MADRKESPTECMGDTAKRAILYVPGTGQNDFDQSASLVADRIARGLKRKQTCGKTFSYRVTVQRDQHHFVRDLSFDVATIEVMSDNRWFPLIDVYELKYLSSFVQPFSVLSPISQAFKAVCMIVRQKWSKMRKLRRGTFKRYDDYGLIDEAKVAFNSHVNKVLLVSIFNWIILSVLSVIIIPGQLVDINLLQKEDLIYKALVYMAIFFALLKILFYNSMESDRKRAIEYCSTMIYYNDQHNFEYINNCLLYSLNMIKQIGYRHVDVLSVSFGSVILADLIYPKDDQAKNRAILTNTTINNWVTVGFPFDFMESQYPDYFGERKFPPRCAVNCWINVVVDRDLIGSKLKPNRGIRSSNGLDVRGPCEEFVISSSKLGTTRQGISRRKMLREIWYLARAYLQRDKNYIKQWKEDCTREAVYHIQYWDDSNPHALTCFDEIVKKAGWTNELAAVTGNVAAV